MDMRIPDRIGAAAPPGGEVAAPTADACARRRILVTGVVQGVGFRPFVYRLARELGLAGFVRNDAGGVTIEVEGALPVLDEFARRLATTAPSLARVDTVTAGALPLRAASGFTIVETAGGRATTAIGPDTAVCPDCLAELFDPADRRWRYAFINCTNCGPRYTITRGLPYDRAQTSMAAFGQCPACLAEYRAPDHRRFHAEPNACPACGPRLALLAPDGAPLDAVDPVAATVLRLARGGIVAIKGLGGFHLACDARDGEAVARLRARKSREAKPFAVMVANAASLAGLAEVGPAERALLESAARPVVLAPKAAGADAALPGVAPGLAWLGAMLPYTPLQYLLFHEAAGRPSGTAWLAAPQPLVLVMTSANPGGEPLVIDNAEAVARLGGIADALLVHDRDIVIRCDDSVVRTASSGAPQFLRRARGYTPLAIRLAPIPRAAARDLPAGDSPAAAAAAGDAPTRGSVRAAARAGAAGGAAASIVATGGWFKNAPCVTRGDEAFLAQHVGDLDNAPTRASLDLAIEHLVDTLQVTPRAVAHDLHPDFYSSHLAARLAAAWDVPAIAVQHHHAHIGAVLAEHRREGPALGVALDGVGLGTDGGAWGGELLLVDGAAATRIGHLSPLKLPGGDRAAREPWRMAAAALARAGRGADIAARYADEPAAATIATLLARDLHAPATTSMGRWFDAAAGLLGVSRRMAFEGQAAMLLEGLAAAHGAVAPDATGYAIGAAGELDLTPLLARLADEGDAGFGAALFHATLVAALAEWIAVAAAKHGLREVAAGGGCFLNAVLARGLRAALAQRGIALLEAEQAPPNDGGLGLGQAWVARHVLSKES